MPLDDFLSKDEILAGLPAKKARTLLFLIENRVGLLKARSRHTMDPFFGEERARELDTAFLEAFSSGKEPPERPAIRDLERFAPSWADLVPENPRLRAAVARALSEKYAFTYSDIPGIRTALGLDQESVQRTFQSLYQQPLASIYRPSFRLGEKLRWTLSRLVNRVENLPPFWTAFSLTLTETVGAAILALPIALARVGPVAGCLLLILFGLINVATIGFMAEAITRSGTIRYGNAFLGQVLSDYLGPTASIVLSIGLGLICFLALQAYYIGFSTTLSDATGIPPWIMTIVLFLLGVYYVTRRSLASTVASALAVGAVNMAVILFISAMALGRLNPEHFGITPPGSKAFDFSILELIFGVVLAAYFGHLSICNCGKVVLRRDPSGRSLIGGAMASMFLTTIVYCVWVAAVNGAIEPGAFEGLPGTAFTPLAPKIGPIVIILGSLFVILGMGMASIHFSLGLFNIVGERLPGRTALMMVLPRRNGRLIFLHRGRKSRTMPRIGLTYLGLKASKAAFLLETELKGQVHREEISTSAVLNLDRILERFRDPKEAKTLFSLEVLEAVPEFARLRCDTLLAVTFEGDLRQIGLHMGSVLDLSEGERKLLNRMLRSGEMSLDQAAGLLEVPVDLAREQLKSLADRGFILQTEAKNGTAYRALVAPRRGSSLPEHIWMALDQTARPSTGQGEGPSSPGLLSTAVLRLKSFLLSEAGRFGLRISPIVAAFLLTEWMLCTGKGSFSGVLNLLGVIVVPLLGGVFPVLMLAASRRKGECTPGRVFRFFGNPLLLTGIYSLFLSGLFIYGLFIYRQTLPRAAVLLVGLFTLLLTIQIIRTKGFARRTAIELRWAGEKGGGNLFQVMSGGEPFVVDIRLRYGERMKDLRSSGGIVENADELESAVFTIPAHGAEELKVFAYRITADGSSSPLDGKVEVSGNGETRSFDLKLANGSLLMPVRGNPYDVTFTFPTPPPSTLSV